MIALPTTKIGRGSCKGITYTQLLATEHGYLYSANINGTIRYEVFRHRVQKAYEFISRGKLIPWPERVQWPNDDSFGKWAWVYTNQDAALDKLLTLAKI